MGEWRRSVAPLMPPLAPRRGDCYFADAGLRSVPMAKTFSSAEVLEVAQKLGVTRGALEAQLRMAEVEGELDEAPTLNAMRALLLILERAEAND